jgi:TolB protein
VAYLDESDGSLVIIDPASGKRIASPARAVVAFLWSPDATKIAYITLGATPSDPNARPAAQDGLILQWHLYDLRDDRVSDLARFEPTSSMVYYLSYFDQFARSHRLWSPDSRYLAYGETLADERQVVTLLDTTAPDAAPQTVMDGWIGVFSWN